MLIGESERRPSAGAACRASSAKRRYDLIGEASARPLWRVASWRRLGSSRWTSWPSGGFVSIPSGGFVVGRGDVSGLARTAAHRRPYRAAVFAAVAVLSALSATAASAAAPAGGLFAFGYNYYGQLGSTTNNSTGSPNPTPTLVTLSGEIGTVTQVAAGQDHSLVATSSGQLYAFGYNYYGQLGSPTNDVTGTPNPTPMLVTLPGEIGTVTRVAAGPDSSLRSGNAVAAVSADSSTSSAAGSK